jgi:DNA-binding protein HU-beta
MSKSDLIDAVAGSAGLTKKQAEEIIDVVFNSVKAAVAKEGTFRYPGFGTFKKKDRAARMGINPKTKEKIEIAASKAVGFKPADEFKNSL